MLSSRNLTLQKSFVSASKKISTELIFMSLQGFCLLHYQAWKTLKTFSGILKHISAWHHVITILFLQSDKTIFAVPTTRRLTWIWLRDVNNCFAQVLHISERFHQFIRISSLITWESPLQEHLHIVYPQVKW